MNGSNSLRVYHTAPSLSTEMQAKTKTRFTHSRRAKSFCSELDSDTQKWHNRRSQPVVLEISPKTESPERDVDEFPKRFMTTQKNKKNSCPSVLSPAEPLNIPENENSTTLNMIEELENLKFEVMQSKEAVFDSNKKVYELTEELRSLKNQSNSDKARFARLLNNTKKTVDEQKTTIKTLTEENDAKTAVLRSMRESLAKSEATNSSRATALKNLRDEFGILKKNLADSAKAESMLQKSNVELLLDNRRLKDAFENLKTQLAQLLNSNLEWEAVVEEQLEILKKDGEDNHLECNLSASEKLGGLKAIYNHRVQLLLKKLFRSDRKSKQLYRTIEKVIKGVHSLMHLQDLKFLKSFDGETYFEGTSELPNRNVVLKLSEWLNTFHSLAYQRQFSGELSDFILSLVENDDPSET